MSLVDKVLGFKRVLVQLPDKASNARTQTHCSSGVVVKERGNSKQLPFGKFSFCHKIFVRKQNLGQKILYLVEI